MKTTGCLLSVIINLFLISLPVDAQVNATPAQVEAVDKAKLINDLMEFSGDKEEIGALPSLLKARLASQQRVMKPEIFSQTSQVLIDSFTSETIYKIVVDNLNDDYQESYALKVLKWLKSPLGQKIRQLEENAVVSKKKEYIESLNVTPPDPQRVKLSQSLDEVSGQSETLVNITASIAVVMTKTLKAAMETDKNIKDDSANWPANWEELTRQKVISSMTQPAHQKSIISILFTYQTLSDDELQQYIDYYRSPEGRWFTDTMNLGLIKALDKIGEVAAHEIVDKANKIIQEDDALKETAYEAVARGMNEAKQGDDARALAAYNKAIGLDPNYADAYGNRAVLYIKLGKPNDAIVDLNKNIAINPKDDMAYNNRGFTYNNLKQFSEAIADYQKAIEINPNYAEAYNNWGVVYKNEGNFDLAIEKYNKAIEIDPSFAICYSNRGYAYLQEEKYAQAIVNYTKAIELNPRLTVAYDNRGVAHEALGEFAQALADYNACLEINPGYREAYGNRAIAYEEQGKMVEALSDFNRLIEMDANDPDGYIGRGLIYSRQHENQNAIDDFNKAIELNPDYGAAYNFRAMSYYQLKQYDQSWADVHKAITLNFKVDPKFIADLSKDSGKNN